MPSYVTNIVAGDAATQAKQEKTGFKRAHGCTWLYFEHCSTILLFVISHESGKILQIHIKDHHRQEMNKINIINSLRCEDTDRYNVLLLPINYIAIKLFSLKKILPQC